MKSASLRQFGFFVRFDHIHKGHPDWHTFSNLFSKIQELSNKLR